MPVTLTRLLILFFALQVVSLQLVPLWGSSEAREAHVAWEVTQGDELILPTRAGIIPSKPPLFHWISGFVYSVSDEVLSPLAVARSVSLIGSLLFLVFSSRIGRLFGDENGLSIIIVLTSWLFLGQSTDAKVDMVFSSFLVGALFFGTKIVRTKKFLLTDWIAGLLLLVLAVLCKGPLAIGLVGLVLTTLIVLENQSEGIGRIMSNFIILIATICVVIGIASIWYLAAANIGGDAFVSRQLLFENLHRIVGHEKMNNQPWWFYIVSISRTTFPWGIGALLIVLMPRFRKNLNDDARTALVLFFVGMVALSCASGKRHSYPLPLLPFLAAGISTQVIHYFKPRAIIRYGYVMTALLAVGACIGLSIKGRTKDYERLATEISIKAEEKKITILKDQFDESLDPIMYFLREKLAPVNQLSDKNNVCLVSSTYKDYSIIRNRPSDKILLSQKDYLLVPCDF